MLAADFPAQIEGAAEAACRTVVLKMPESPVHEKLTQALLESVADDILAAGAQVVALYSGFEAGTIDSISLIHLGEHLGQLTARDLRSSKPACRSTRSRPWSTWPSKSAAKGAKASRSARCSSSATRAKCWPAAIRPVSIRCADTAARSATWTIRACARASRKSRSSTARSWSRPTASSRRSARYIDAPADNITLPKGLGARHWAAAAISRKTNAVAVAVSESNGTVRIFSDGEVTLRIEPFRRPMKWKDFEYEPPPAE